MRILILNAGSSTLKWTLLDADDRSTVDAGSEPWLSLQPNARHAQLDRVLGAIDRVDAVGHRVVHGGMRFRASVVVDAATRTDLEDLADLDRTHMLPALAGIDAVNRRFPSVPQVAAFDTAFHATISEPAGRYALPFQWNEQWGLRRYGFHGLSVEYSVARVHELSGLLPSNIIVCHLGSGCSVTAVAAGHSIDTTMGFTPLDGVMMSTRSGSVDPGLLLHLVTRRGVSIEELGDVLEHRSGLLGVSGVAGDLRLVLAADTPRARLAYAQFVWTLKRAIGAMCGVLNGIDALVFTGGIGENDARVRRDVAGALAFAGLRLSNDLPGSDDRLVSTPDSSIAAWVVHAREDLVVLREVLRHASCRSPRPS